MQPVTVMAVRERRRGVPPALPPRDVTIRLADLQDLTAVVSLVMEEHRYEEHFGSVFIQPETAEQTRKVAARALSRNPSWIWLAERRGRPSACRVSAAPGKLVAPVNARPPPTSATEQR